MNLGEASAIIQKIVPSNYVWLLDTDDECSTLILMEENGRAFARLYQYLDDLEIVYLNWLTVIKPARRQGLGTELQKIREQIGKEIGATCALLEVVEDSWMRNWYIRRGYSEVPGAERDGKYVWLYKNLTKNNMVW